MEFQRAVMILGSITLINDAGEEKEVSINGTYKFELKKGNPPINCATVTTISFGANTQPLIVLRSSSNVAIPPSMIKDVVELEHGDPVPKDRLIGSKGWDEEDLPA
jgi:hypothetical protein